ncbi:MAG: ferritin [Deltaproteobacteria bacterium]|nr:ferritin [Deltaproteobacteria bacterium]
MRIRDLRRVITTIILTAPLAAGCVTGSCPDPAPIVTERVLIDMPDAQLMTLLASCKMQQDCQPLCTEVYRREYGFTPTIPPPCTLEVDSTTGLDVALFPMEQHCIGGRRPGGYRPGRGCGPTVGRYLAQQAELEAASVRAFADLHDDLRALGAPARLRRAAITAAGDEVRHARTCERLARQHGATPALREVAPAQRRSLRQLALDNLVEGCIRETYGAVVAGYQGRTAGDATVRHAMRAIARDEARHATLSWRIHAWLSPQLSPDERRELADAAETVRRELADGAEPDVDLTRVLGVPDGPVASAMLAQLDATVWAEL